MKKVIFTSLFIFLFAISKSQNLVPNGSFEAYDTCPSNINGGLIRYADFWGNPNNSTPDYFNACDVSGAYSVPYNISGGDQYPFQGNAYIGLVMYVDTPFVNAREYGQVQLISPLQTDSCYRLRFYVSIGDMLDYYKITNFDAHFSTTPISSTDAKLLPYLPQFSYFDSSGIGDTISCYKVEGVFQAQGGETYMTIGNFRDDASTTRIIFNSSCIYGGYAYYFVDSISLTKVTCPLNIGIEENENVTALNVFPNPSTSEITIEFELSETKNVSIEIKNVLGQTIKIISNNTYTKGNNKIEMDLSDFSNGIYFIRLQSGNKISNRKFIKQ